MKSAFGAMVALVALLIIAGVLVLTARADAVVAGVYGRARVLGLVASVDSTDSFTDFPCGTRDRESLAAGERTTRYTCGLRAGAPVEQRVDVLELHLEEARTLRVGRVCSTTANSPLSCRWSATAGAAPWPDAGLVVASSLTRKNDPSADIVVDELPALSVVRVGESHDRQHYLDIRTGEEIYSSTLEARRQALLLVPRSALLVAMAGAIAVIGLLLWSGRRRRVDSAAPRPVDGTIYRGPAPIDPARARADAHAPRLNWLRVAMLLVLGLSLVPAGAAWARRGDRTVPAPGGGSVDPLPTAQPSDAGCPSDMALLEGGRFEGARGETAAGEPPATRTSWIGPFCLDRTEVTRGSYAACIARGICRRSYLMNTSTFCDPETKEREREPVTCVLSFDADTYCGHLGRRLPTDDEWLFAARGRAVGGHGRRFPWGDEPPDATRLDVSGLEPVGSFPLGATPEGILDLAGNVSEITSTTVPAAGSIIRGGSYLVPLVDEARERTITEHGDPGIGFRCAK